MGTNVCALRGRCLLIAIGKVNLSRSVGSRPRFYFVLTYTISFHHSSVSREGAYGMQPKRPPSSEI